jgi:hypothetical protein
VPAEPPPEPSPQAAVEPAQGAARARRERERALSDAERRVNSPTPLTLQLLGVVCVATVVPWFLAKAACNLRDSPIRQPHDLPTETLAKNAKSAALEMAQRAASGRYREAAELARGDLAKELLDADARCQTEPAACERRRSLADRVFTRAVVASRGPFEASARTESRVGDDPPERYALRLTQEEGRWYVVRRTPLEGEIDAPVLPDEVVAPIAIRPSAHGHGNMSVAPGGGVTLPVPGQSPPPAGHNGAPHGSAPSSGAPSGTDARTP